MFWSPPLRDPFNYNLDPLLVLGLQSLGAAMHTRLAAEGKAGATMRSGGPYDGWWNGGIRNTAAFHNMIAMLTEMIGSPTPMRIPLVLQRQMPTSDLAFPVAPQEWHFRQSIDYSMSLNRACSTSRRGCARTCSTTSTRWARTRSSAAAATRGRRAAPLRGDRRRSARRGPAAGGGRGGGAAARRAATMAALWAALHKPEDRDPRGYIMPSNQPDFPTATKFINALLETGITCSARRARSRSQGKKYPAGSFVVKTAQAFRPHVIDMFEPQDHPDDFPYPGAPPTPPYDNAGWTLAYPDGRRVRSHPRGVHRAVRGDDRLEHHAAAGHGAPRRRRAAAIVISQRQVDSFAALNRLLGAGEEVYRELTAPFIVERQTLPGRNVVRAARSRDADRCEDRGVASAPARRHAAGQRAAAAAPRIGLWDQYGGSMDAGWARWILEQFEFPFERVFAPQLDAGNLNAKYDVLSSSTGGDSRRRRRRRGGGGGGGGGGGAAAAPNIPAEYRGQIGRVTVEHDDAAAQAVHRERRHGRRDRRVGDEPRART